MKNYLRSHAKGLHRIHEELAGELLESARQAAEQSRRTVGARYKNRVVINKASTKADQNNKPAETEQKEIVEVKPGLFGIIVDIKELAKRFRKWVCSRRKD